MGLKNKNRKIFFAFTISISILLFSVSFAFLNILLQGEKRQAIVAGNLQLILDEDNNNLTISNALPIYDEVGMIQEPFTFKLVNNGNIPIHYIVKLVDVTPENIEKLDTNIVKYGLTKDGSNAIDFLSNLENSQIDSGMILANQTIGYDLRLWIDFVVEDEGLINGKSLSYRIDVEAGQVDGTERKIQFDSNGGQLTETTKTVVVGEKYGELPSSAKAGYNFLGWFNEKDEYVDENTILDAFTKKLTAKWGVNQYTVAFNPNGGSVSPNNKQVGFNDVYGELPIPTKGNSIFLGWFTELEAGDKIESTSVMNVASNHTLYAHWKDPYQDNSGASRPVLSNELIPVKIASNGTVTKANIYEEWYDYDNKEWANAVILSDRSISYNDGQTIPESNIESYFVWIPRFKYKIFNTGNYSSTTSLNANAPQTIEIEFEDKTETLSKGTTVGSWLSHPAFQAFDSNGFWVGKFESSYKDATSTTTAEVNSSDYTKLQIKPNKYSWRNITLGNAFKVSYDYARDLESHMIKNTEWGAVAFLQHSKYGSRKNVRGNNNNNYVTGYASVEEPTIGASNGVSISGNVIGTTADVTRNYYTTIGYLASTTANISGVYDMSGGSWEYAMGYNSGSTTVGGESNIASLYSDFFTNSKWNKYYDKYINTSSSDKIYNFRILGDATGEMGPFQTVMDPTGFEWPRASWYKNYAVNVNTQSCWFFRGGYMAGGNGNGIFSFSNGRGEAEAYGSFRVVLTPTK